MNMSKLGVIYIATGSRFVEEACQSVVSLKQHNPNLPVTLFSNQIIDDSLFDRVVKVQHPQFSYLDKPLYMGKSPYQHTLFLDTDTYIYGNLDDVFSLLDRFDLALAHDPYRQNLYPLAGVSDAFPEFNTGVIAFKKSGRTNRLFQQWTKIYQRDLNKPDPPHHDQPALREALWQADELRIATLIPEYNCRFIYPGFVSGAVKILHGRANPEHAASVLNSELRPRVHALTSDGVKIVAKKPAGKFYSDLINS